MEKYLEVYDKLLHCSLFRNFFYYNSITFSITYKGKNNLHKFINSFNWNLVVSQLILTLYTTNTVCIYNIYDRKMII